MALTESCFDTGGIGADVSIAGVGVSRDAALNAAAALFGESASRVVVSTAREDAKRVLERAAAAAVQADLVLALGSTLSVHPAASIPLLAVERGTPYIIVNQGETGHDDHPSVTLRLEADVTAVVPAAVEAALALPESL